MDFKLSIEKSDALGAIASFVCMIHCAATPFIFIAQSCTTTSSCCASSPLWWSAIDYIFIVITFFAVHFSVKNTSLEWVKKPLYASWVILTLFIINEKASIFMISPYWKYATAFTLIGLHLYNRHHCKCQEDNCCVQ